MWPSRPATPAFRVTAPGLERVLARVAELVAASPGGSGLLVEGPIAGGAVRLVASGAVLHQALVGLTAEFPGALVPEPAGPAPAPPRPDLPEWYGRGRFPGALGTDPGAVAPAVALPPGTWLGVQSHWFPDGRGGVRRHVRWRLAGRRGAGGDGRLPATAALRGRLPGSAITWERATRTRRRRWTAGVLPRTRWPRAADLLPAGAAWDVRPAAWRAFPAASELDRHVVVFGASGSGKTTFLARLLAQQVAAGRPALVIDVHGDLVPSVLGRLPGPERTRWLALEPGRPGPGIPVLDGGTGTTGEREAAFVVAALKRLSADGPELYWGFRLERIFETFVRVVQAEGGTLLDLYALLTDARRREAARLTTREPAIAAFLDELPAVLRRNPEFLGPAAARLAKVALSDELSALLAPADERALRLGAALRAGRSVALRLPLDRLGPEASSLVATLALTRAYLELVSAPSAGPAVLVVLDEATVFSARLVAEILTDGRKFGVRVVLATQFPDRLAPEVRHAAAGSAGTHVVFRVPVAAAAGTGAWIGLSPTEARRELPGLGDGWALVAPAGGDPHPRLVVERRPPPAPSTDAAWNEALARTGAAFPTPDPGRSSPLADAEEEAILLRLYGADAPVPLGELVGRPGAVTAEVAAARLERLGGLRRRGWVVEGSDGFRLHPAGARSLGATIEHGAANEGAEHRRLLLDAFRIFARRGERLELVRQGRFDTRLPDARLVVVPPELRGGSPAALSGYLNRRRGDWAWRYFGGRDVFVEAEVSGADRPERVRRDLDKGRRAGAFVLFLVPDARRARRVRAHADRSPSSAGAWSVWTLPRDGRGGAKTVGPLG